jgi:ankyrin repeat protein
MRSFTWIIAGLLSTFGLCIHCHADDIHNACVLNDVAKVKELLKTKPELVDSTDNRFRKPLHYAAQRGYVEIIEVLLAYKADINAKVTERSPDGILGWTPLHLAAERGRVAAVELLVSKGADIEAKDVWGRTPLFLAALEGQVEVLKVLVKNKANINVRDKNGKTPLMRAIEADRRDVIDFLRSNGAQEPGDSSPSASP